MQPGFLIFKWLISKANGFQVILMNRCVFLRMDARVLSRKITDLF